MDLQEFWFAILGVLLAGYAILDGFDLGVGILHLSVQRDQDRRILMNAIGPLWDGNEVWLVTFGGALFAAFPEAYATAFSAYYLPFMVLLFALIFRAVSMEFRSKRESPRWRQAWDVAFCAASTLATFLFGVAVGGMMRGLPVGPDGEFQGTLLDLVHPYALVVGLMAVALFAMHGSIYLYLKTEGELQERIHRWMWRTFFGFLVLYLLTTVLTFYTLPTAIENFRYVPAAWGVAILTALALANIPRAIHHRRPGYAFFSSACTIAALVFFMKMAMAPNLVTSTLDPAYSLTIRNASSSSTTLGIMAVIAAIGMPFVLAYTGLVYWVFRGKVQLGEASY
jgi:cytochrome d ubiquinol oxidase subunit II